MKMCKMQVNRHTKQSTYVNATSWAMSKPVFLYSADEMDMILCSEMYMILCSEMYMLLIK